MEKDDEKKRDEIYRFNIIKPFIEKEKTLKEISHQNNISYATIKRWIKNYKEQGTDGLKIKNRSDKNSFRKVDEKLKENIEKIYNIHKEKALSVIYKEMVSNFNHSISFNTFYRVVSNLDGYLKNKTSFQINKNLECGEIYIVKHFISYHFIDMNGVKKLPFIVLLFNASNLDFINFYVTFDLKFDFKFFSFLRKSILKGFEIYNTNRFPKEILINSSFDIPKKNKKDILEQTGIKLLEFDTENENIEEFISFLSKDLDSAFKNEIKIEELIEFLKNYSSYNYYDIKYKVDTSDIINKLNYFFPKLQRKVHSYGIRISNNFYNELFLKKYINEIVDIVYDPLKLDFIYLYYENKFIGKIAIKL